MSHCGYVALVCTQVDAGTTHLLFGTRVSLWNEGPGLSNTDVIQSCIALESVLEMTLNANNRPIQCRCGHTSRHWCS